MKLTFADRQYWLPALALTLLCGLCLSQDVTSEAPDQSTPPARSQTPTTQPRQEAFRVAPGSVIPVQLTETVDVKKARTGDEVVAKVTQDLKTVNGEVVMPKNSTVVGHVTEAQVRSKEQKESRVGIAFDHAVTNDGSVASLQMSIQAVILQPLQDPDHDDGGGQMERGPTASLTGGLPGNRNGRPGEIGTGPQQAPTLPADGETPNITGNGSKQRLEITANTQGIVGMPDYKLSTIGDSAQGSVVSSDKSNVKLESGTFMLLRVNQ